MVAWGAIIPAVASVASSAIGAFGSRGSSALSIEDQKSLMDYQHQLNLQSSFVDYNVNKDYMNRQYKYDRALNKQSFDYSKWFSQHQYQNTMLDLQNAGLNPLLAISNGANGGSFSSGGSVGLPHSATSATGLLDPSSVTSANAQKLQARLGILGAINGTLSSVSNAAKAFEEAKTEANKRDNLDVDSSLKSLQGMRQIIENSNLDKKYKAEIDNLLSQRELNLVNAQYQKAIIPYAIKEKSASAKSMLQNASSNAVNAQANYINATQGNWQKAVLDLVKGMTGNTPAQTGRNIKKSMKNYRGSLSGLYN